MLRRWLWFENGIFINGFLVCSNYCWEVLRTLRFFSPGCLFSKSSFNIFCEYILRPFPTSVFSRGVLNLCGLRMHDMLETSWCIGCEHWQQDCLRQRLHTQKSEYGVRNRSVKGNYSIVIILLLQIFVTISDTVCVFQCWCTMSVFVSTYLVYIDTMYIYIYTHGSVYTFWIGGYWYFLFAFFFSPSRFFSGLCGTVSWHGEVQRLSQSWGHWEEIHRFGASEKCQVRAMKKGPLQRLFVEDLLGMKNYTHFCGDYIKPL